MISLTVTKEGGASFMDELEAELRSDFETAWSLFARMYSKVRIQSPFRRHALIEK
jgi:hypothetical protein